VTNVRDIAGLRKIAQAYMRELEAVPGLTGSNRDQRREWQKLPAATRAFYEEFQYSKMKRAIEAIEAVDGKVFLRRLGRRKDSYLENREIDHLRKRREKYPAIPCIDAFLRVVDENDLKEIRTQYAICQNNVQPKVDALVAKAEAAAKELREKLDTQGRFNIDSAWAAGQVSAIKQLRAEIDALIASESTSFRYTSEATMKVSQALRWTESIWYGPFVPRSLGKKISDIPSPELRVRLLALDEQGSPNRPGFKNGHVDESEFRQLSPAEQETLERVVLAAEKPDTYHWGGNSFTRWMGWHNHPSIR
jgi:hypothetical protein